MGHTPEGTVPGLMGSSTPGTLGGGGAIPGDVPDTPALETPRAIVLEPTHLARRQHREEVEGDGVRGWFRATPHNDNSADGGAVLHKAPSRVDTRELLSTSVIHIHGVTSEDVLRVLARPLRGVLRDERQRQELTQLDAFQYVRALS